MLGIHDLQDFEIVEYRSQSENCIRSFDNRYIPTPQERKYTLNWPNNYPQSSLAKPMEFQAKLPGLPDTFEAYVEFEKVDGGHIAILFGPDLRGPSQIPNGWFADYRLMNPAWLGRVQHSPGRSRHAVGRSQDPL